MRQAIQGLPRYIATPETAEHRLFVWLAYPVLPDKNIIVIPRADDLMFGLLHNRFHEMWALRKGSDLQDRPRYTHTTTFATFPFPDGMTPDVPVATAQLHPAAAAIEQAAKRLDELRTAWLYPADQVIGQPEVDPRFPDRLLPKDQAAAHLLNHRTLTRLYNDRPLWLVEAHTALDEAVAAAYGWSSSITDAEVLRHLLELNVSRVNGSASMRAASDRE
jgi:type II restriction/modification system DNA methylase subunit YeeA